MGSGSGKRKCCDVSHVSCDVYPDSCDGLRVSCDVYPDSCDV